MNPVVHFEMPYLDRERMAKFYTEAFGWKTQMTGPEFGNYVVVHTGPTDENNMVQTPGAINGGFFEKTADSAYPSVVLNVDDIHEAIRKLEAAGGKVVREPVEIPGIGTYASFTDTEGNRAGLMQPVAR